ncbi:MAG TPA: hypothetical protein DD827_05100 [Gammaproteobacteria bacterium]|nr:hypothetical protein [Gammaproteobacteria bacterium]
MQMKPKTAAAIPVLLLFGAMSANAAQWRNEPFASASLRYDDNIRFVTGNAESSVGTVFDVGVSMVNESEVTKTIFQPRAAFSGYASDGDLDSADQFLDFLTDFRGERTYLSFGINYVRDSSVTSELEDTGIVAAAVRRNYLNVSPRWEYRFSQKNALQFGYNYRSVDWDDSDNSGLEDNNTDEVWGAYKLNLSEHDDLSFKLSQTQFESPESGFDSTTTGVDLSFVRRLSEVNRFELGLGGWNADLESPDGSSESESGGSLSGAVVHQDETRTYRVSLSQLVVPSSSGQVRQDRRLNGFYDYKFNPRLHWGVDGVFIQTEGIGSSVIENDRDYFTFRPFLAWEWKPKVTLSGSVRISTQELVDTGAKSDRNELLFTVRYGTPQVAY